MQKAEFLQNLVKEHKKNFKQRLFEAVEESFLNAKPYIWEEMQKTANSGYTSFFLRFNSSRTMNEFTGFYKPEEFTNAEFFSRMWEYVVDELQPIGYEITAFWFENEFGNQEIDSVQIRW